MYMTKYKLISLSILLELLIFEVLKKNMSFNGKCRFNYLPHYFTDLEHEPTANRMSSYVPMTIFQYPETEQKLKKKSRHSDSCLKRSYFFRT